MRESLCNSSVENIIDTFIVHVCFSSCPQDFDPRRIRGSGNVCYTGMDEEEDDDNQASDFPHDTHYVIFRLKTACSKYNMFTRTL